MEIAGLDSVRPSAEKLKRNNEIFLRPWTRMGSDTIHVVFDYTSYNLNKYVDFTAEKAPIHQVFYGGFSMAPLRNDFDLGNSFALHLLYFVFTQINLSS